MLYINSLNKKMITLQRPKYAEINITTKTSLFSFDKTLNDIDLLASIIPLTKVFVPEHKMKKGTKYKLTEFPPKHSIYSARTPKISRGLQSPSFKNLLMCNMSMGNKSVNIKISGSTIHISGTKDNQALEITNYICSMINKLDLLVAKMTKTVKWDKIVDFFRSKYTGTNIVKVAVFNDCRVKVRDRFKFRRVLTGYDELVEYTHPSSQEILKGMMECDIVNPDYILSDVEFICDFFNTRFRECFAIDEICIVLDFLKSKLNGETPSLLFDGTGSVNIKPLSREVMKNISFNIGFPVLREFLVNKINGASNLPLVAIHNPAYDHFIKVKYITPEGKHLHTFVLYKSGHVMMSSKDPKYIESGFNSFVDFMYSVYPEVVDSYFVPKNKPNIPKKKDVVVMTTDNIQIYPIYI